MEQIQRNVPSGVPSYCLLFASEHKSRIVSKCHAFRQHTHTHVEGRKNDATFLNRRDSCSRIHIFLWDARRKRANLYKARTLFTFRHRIHGASRRLSTLNKPQLPSLTGWICGATKRPGMDGAAPSFRTRVVAKPASYLSLLTKQSSVKWREQTYTGVLVFCRPANTNSSHFCRILESAGRQNSGPLPSQPRKHITGAIAASCPEHSGGFGWGGRGRLLLRRRRPPLLRRK